MGSWVANRMLIGEVKAPSPGDTRIDKETVSCTYRLDIASPFRSHDYGGYARVATGSQF